MTLPRRAGFSMVEVALALLILSIGVLTMIGLMSGGLDMSKAAVDYTQTSIFASDVLDSVRHFAVNDTPTNGTYKFWDRLRNSFSMKPVAAVTTATSIFDADTMAQNIRNNPSAFVNLFYSYQTNVDFVCRYRLAIEQGKDPVSGAVLTGNLVDQVAAVKLEVVNGLYGAATTQSFYTEIFQFVR